MGGGEAALGGSGPVGWAALIASYLIQKDAQDTAEARRAQTLGRAADTESALVDKGINITQGAAAKYGGEARAANAASAENTTRTALAGDLAAAQPAGGIPPSYSGKVSDAYLAKRATATAGELDRAAKLTQLMAKVRAPGVLRLEEGLSNADAASRVAANVGDMTSAQRGGQLDFSRIMPNQGEILGGQLLGTVGANMGPRTARLRDTGIFGNDYPG